MQVAYNTRKLFADGSEELRIKIGKEVTLFTTQKAQKTKKENKIKKRIRHRQLKEAFNKLRFTDEDYFKKKRRIEIELNARDLQSIRRSVNRTRQNLYDICKCNDFDFFVTFTYSPEQIDRLSDEKVKRKFTQWANNVRKKFPNMNYVATPEYHKGGGLHFHLLIGGVSFEDLKCEAATNKKGNLIFKNGKQIFNVTAWKWGYSTLSKIENTAAAKQYICKYITKQYCDDRFFHKRRFYTSHNIRRPSVTRWTENPEYCLDNVDLNLYLISYADVKKGFAVLTTDGNALVDFDRNTPQSRSDLAGLRCIGQNTKCPAT